MYEILLLLHWWQPPLLYEAIKHDGLHLHVPGEAAFHEAADPPTL